MITNPSSKRIHPLVAGAAVALIVVSLVGVAAITGILPNSNSKNDTQLASRVYPDSPANTLAANVEAKQGVYTPYVDENKPHKAAVQPRVQSQQQVYHQAPQQVYRQAPESQYQAPQPARDTYRENYKDTQVARAPAVCDNCGTIESVRTYSQPAAQGSGLGAVAGAVLGGVLGNQVGNGDGRKLATVAGAVGGGYAGNAIEKSNRGQTTYEVRVRMQNGHVRTFNPTSEPGWRNGDRVRIVNGSLVAD